MTDEEQKQMDRYGITMETKPVYRYKTYKYDHLADALNFAAIDSAGKEDGGRPKRDS
jgi:hypothetical protein